MIWAKKYQLEEVNKMCLNSMVTHLGILFTEIGHDYLKARMPIDQRTVQPMGMLHGGASVALAETIGSVASALCINQDKYFCVGLEVNANHIKSKTEGLVSGTGQAIHLGRTTHIWQIKIEDEENKLICISRLTIAVLEKQTHNKVKKIE